ncbi:hypothetical protein JXR93_07460 [bacterium]|nr:hypothetical protein [bacterium]
MKNTLNITCITGYQGTGKTTYLQNLINSKTVGVLTKSIDRDLKKYNFVLHPYLEEFECCSYNFLTKTMVFNKESFYKVNKYIKSIEGSSSIIIDEIGRLELFEDGLSDSFKYIINNHQKYENIYIGIRYDILDLLLRKYNFLPKEIILLKK